jgi:sugar phosphate isomerase/epimerase
MFSTDRRRFLQSGALGTVGLAASTGAAVAEEGTGKPLAFQLGLVTYNLAPAWDLPTILQICKAVGISPVELRTTHKHGVEPALTKEQRREVRQRFADSGITFWGCGTVCEFQSPDVSAVQANIETCKRFVDLVADLGGKGVKVRPNGLPKAVPVEKTLEQIGKSLIPCGRAGADAGVEIWVEVHGTGTSLPANIHTIMQHCGHPQVGLTWNSNATDVQNGSVAAAFNLLSKWIRSCHINDLYRDQTGTYPYRELFRLFRGIGYDRATLCEVGGSLPDPKVGAEFLRYYKALWHELASR